MQMVILCTCGCSLSAFPAQVALCMGSPHSLHIENYGKAMKGDFGF